MTGALHAILGASSSHRWMECPGSIRESIGMPNESSVHARTGSCAHAVAADCLETGKDAIEWLDEEVKDYEDIPVTEEMCDAVQTYLDTVRGAIEVYTDAGFHDHELSVEVRFDLSHIYADMFGTCDAVVYFPEWKKIIVYDYKHGWVGVAAERNPQTMYYGLGALTGKHNRPIEHIELVIVQPRTHGQRAAIKSWNCDPIELVDFRADLIEAAKRTEDPAAPLKAGEWCKWCPAAAKCRALENFMMEVACGEFDMIEGTMKPKPPEQMTPAELALAWRNANIMEGYAKSVKGYAHAQAIAGNLPPGTKLVEGRSRRKWKDEEEAKTRLEALQAMDELEGEIFNTKMKSPAQIETLLGKKKKSKIDDLWVKGTGALSLVDEKDERDVAKASAEDEFSGM